MFSREQINNEFIVIYAKHSLALYLSIFLSICLSLYISLLAIFHSIYLFPLYMHLSLAIFLSIHLSPSFFQSSSVSISISLPLFRLNALGTISNWKWLTREGERATKREGRNENEKCFDDKLAKKKTSSDQVSWKKSSDGELNLRNR